MTDRPRPQYGEYATPEEQARATGWPQPAMDANPSQPARDASPVPVSSVQATARKPRRWDLVLTLALLAAGLANVIATYPQYADLFGVLSQVYSQFGYDEYASPDLAAGIGIALNLSQVAILLTAVLVSISRLRSGKLAFPVPLIGAAVGILVAFVLLIVAMVGDPVLLASLPTA